LTNVTASVAEAQVFVTAQFIEPELFLPTSFVPESKNEAVSKSKQGVISGDLEKIDSALSYIENVPFVGSYVNSYRTLARPLTSVAKFFGLSKPTTIAVGQVTKNNPFADMANGKGIDLSLKLAMDPENRISVMPNIGGTTQDQMELRTIAGTPKLYQILTMNSGDTFPVSVFNISNDKATMGFFDFVANNFAAWSGSVKIKLYFTASVMQTARIVLYLSRDLNDDWMQCYHEVVDVCGDTEYETTLPYPDEGYALPVGTNVPWELGIKVIAWSQPDPALDNPVFINIYRAAADDIQFWGQIERAYTFDTESNPRADFAKPFKTMHPSMRTYVPQNIIYGEKHTHIKEMLHKYYPYKAVTNGTQTKGYNLTALNSLYTSGIEMLSMIFAFWAGSIRHKYLVNGNTLCYMFICTDAGIPYIGTSCSSTMNPIIEGEIPFYTNQSFKHTRGDIASTPSSTPEGASPFLFKSVGDDYTLHFLCAWPSGTFNKPAATVGYQAFTTYVNA